MENPKPNAHGFFITSHVIPCATGGTFYRFPKALRDVYACRVRCLHSNGGFDGYPNLISIVCPDLVSGYREASVFRLLRPGVLAFFSNPTNTIPPNVYQPKHLLMSDIEIVHLQFYFKDASWEDIPFTGEASPMFIIDFWHRNIHEY